MSRFELLDEIDLPFPLGGAFGYWGYDLKNFTEPKLPRRAVNDLELPDCHVGFYDSLVVFDHRLGKVSVVSTGLNADGSRSETRADEKLEFWRGAAGWRERRPPARPGRTLCANLPGRRLALQTQTSPAPDFSPPSNTRSDTSAPATFTRSTCRTGSRRIGCGAVARRVDPNLERRRPPATGWEFFQKFSAVSPAPFSAFLDCGDFEIASSSPEQFLRLSGSHIVTRPIKGTRPRDSRPDARRAARLRIADQPEGTRRTGDDHRFAAE